MILQENKLEKNKKEVEYLTNLLGICMGMFGFCLMLCVKSIGSGFFGAPIENLESGDVLIILILVIVIVRGVTVFLGLRDEYRVRRINILPVIQGMAGGFIGLLYNHSVAVTEAATRWTAKGVLAVVVLIAGGLLSSVCGVLVGKIHLKYNYAPTGTCRVWLMGDENEPQIRVMKITVDQMESTYQKVRKDMFLDSTDWLVLRCLLEIDDFRGKWKWLRKEMLVRLFSMPESEEDKNTKSIWEYIHQNYIPVIKKYTDDEGDLYIAGVDLWKRPKQGARI